MQKSRLEAFSDGVIAIIITIMVLELKVPHGEEWSDLTAIWPVFLSYVLSFTHVAIYWNNHHHLIHTVKRVTGGILWANVHLLFWLSLVPFATAWLGENHFAATPAAAYGVVLVMCGIAYYILTRSIIASQGQDSVLEKAVGKDKKGLISLALYITAIAVAPWLRQLSMAIYVAVAIMWLVPDSRIEKMLTKSE